VLSPAAEQTEIRLDANDGREAVDAAAVQLGYDLSEEDRVKVYEEFCRVSRNRQVGSKELEAVIASVALQVPATYQIKAYVVNNGNVISSTAQITMEKNGETMQGISIGDGPIDAAFRAIEQIVGHRYELDDFQIQSVTEGKEAMGSALVKLRADGKLYSGNGISTDIIGASIRAYINAINKIVYEEVQA
jgi:2-isopropylmalate synthase